MLHLVVILFILFNITSGTILTHTCNFTFIVNRSGTEESQMQSLYDNTTQTVYFMYLDKTYPDSLRLTIAGQSTGVCELIHSDYISPQSYENETGWTSGYNLVRGAVKSGQINFGLVNSREIFFMQLGLNSLTLVDTLDIETKSYEIQYGGDYVLVSVVDALLEEARIYRYHLISWERAEYINNRSVDFFVDMIIVGEHVLVGVGTPPFDLTYYLVNMTSGTEVYNFGNFSRNKGIDFRYDRINDIIFFFDNTELTIYDSNSPFGVLNYYSLPGGVARLALDRNILVISQNCSTPIYTIDFSDHTNIKNETYIIQGSCDDSTFDVLELSLYNIIGYNEYDFYILPEGGGTPTIWLSTIEPLILVSGGTNIVIVLDPSYNVDVYEMTDDLNNNFVSVMYFAPEDLEYLFLFEYERGDSSGRSAHCLVHDNLLTCHIFQTVTLNDNTTEEDTLTTASMETNMETRETITSTDIVNMATTDVQNPCVLFSANCDTPGVVIVTGTRDISNIDVTGVSLVVKNSNLRIRNSKIQFDSLDLENSALRLEYPSGVSIENELNIKNSSLVVDLDSVGVEQIQEIDQLLIPTGAVVGEFEDVTIFINGEMTEEIGVVYQEDGIYLSYKSNDTMWIILGVSVAVAVVVLLVVAIILLTKNFLCAGDT